ncbi:MAG: T9SS type A sorting domain-containing protein [Chitinophagaceae bacterium]|nr:MAG: T9SS type A sorting domain-containing protein [Chitinophagaceae bacterium]
MFRGYQVTDASGRVVLKKQVAPGTASPEINVSSLPAGWYLLELQGKTTERATFIKN